MDIFSTLWTLLTRPFNTLSDIRRDQLLFQGIIMEKIDELLALANDAATAAAAASAAATAALDAVRTIQPAVDAFEKRITELLSGVVTPDLNVKLQEAIDTLRATVAVSKKAAEDAAAAAEAATVTAADANDGIDEAAPVIVPDPPVDPIPPADPVPTDPPVDPESTSRKSGKNR